MIPQTRRRSFPSRKAHGGVQWHVTAEDAGPKSAGSRALPPPINRDHSPPLPAASTTSEPPFEVEDLRSGAQAGSQQSLRRQQRDVVAGRAIDLDEVAHLKILDARSVEGEHSGLFDVPGLFPMRAGGAQSSRLASTSGAKCSTADCTGLWRF
jgi:hypothetical protein